ncbi:MAG: YdcH family protein [Gammaproteobacteria bacterium]
MSAPEIESLKQQLADLQLEHRALDTAIQGLEENTYVDQLQMRRLKKRKLQLKDAIQRLQSQLIPDLNA